MKTQTLYRPVGLKEMELIAESGWQQFPPRLEWQPIFYPVLNQQYAEQIASEWNTNDAFSGYCGIVTSFDVNRDYLKAFDVQNVGGEIHNELWIPSGELDVFNSNIINGIKIVNAFVGEHFVMPHHSPLSIELLKFV
ncbi:MAG: ADP-ribosylation/crystallin J1 [Bacteroidota bacterium]